jgi:hypothetical protein
MILSDCEKEREASLQTLISFQRVDFEAIFEAMQVKTNSIHPSIRHPSIHPFAKNPQRMMRSCARSRFLSCKWQHPFINGIFATCRAARSRSVSSTPLSTNFSRVWNRSTPARGKVEG